MDDRKKAFASQIAAAASDFQLNLTGHRPKSVEVVMGAATLMITLREALSPAEKVLAQSPAGAAKLQEYHRQLFANSSGQLGREIARIMGVNVQEASSESTEIAGTAMHAFTTGTMVQIFHFARDLPVPTPGEFIPPVPIRPMGAPPASTAVH